MQWEVVIGLEIHAQLATKTKIFSGASTAYGADANTQACLVSLGMPGVLPVLNQEVVNMAIRFAMSIQAELGRSNVFARKNYFYPDLPKGYQISQFEQPIVGKGQVSIPLKDGREKVIRVTRAHLEEDAGRSVHDKFRDMTGIDLNRAGTPLLEIVSEPDMRSAEEAVAYARKIHQLVRYIGICDGNMQEGSFRCDANVSIRPMGAEKLGTRTELKNINSFRFLERAITLEIARQIDIKEAGGKVVQETRLYDALKDETRSMRSKEEANDYRYFPDPDLLPVEITDEMIDKAFASLPELPDAKAQRFEKDYALNRADALLLTGSREMADYFEVTATGTDAKLAANWITGALFAGMNRKNMDIADVPVSAEHLRGLIKRIVDNTISGKIAKEVFEAMWNGEGTTDEIIKARGLQQITDAGAIEAIVDAIIANNQEQVENYRKATPDKQTRMLGFFVGQVMKASKGKANPNQVNALLKDKL